MRQRLIADSDSGERVVLLDETGVELYRFASETNANGLAEGEFHLPLDRAGRLTIMARVEQTLGRDSEAKAASCFWSRRVSRSFQTSTTLLR